MHGEEESTPAELGGELEWDVGGRTTGTLEARLEHRVLGQKGEVDGFLQKMTLVN